MPRARSRWLTALLRNATRMVAILAVGLPRMTSAQPAPAVHPWRPAEPLPQGLSVQAYWVSPPKFRALTLDQEALGRQLAAAPQVAARPLAAEQSVIILPLPVGTDQQFRMVESPVMEPALAAKFPEIKTYLGQGIDDPSATVRLDLTPAGFHAQILSPNGAVYIDPHLRDRSV